MTVKTISYQKSFVIGPYLQEKIGVEIDLNENDDLDEAFITAKRMTETWHKENNPGLYIENTITDEVSIPQNQTQLRDTVQYIIEDIQSCTDIKVLESYSLIAKSSPKVKEAYDNKYQELQNK